MLIPEAQKHTDPADPDPDANPGPKHCFFYICYRRLLSVAGAASKNRTAETRKAVRCAV
jgi:hypothetical protein